MKRRPRSGRRWRLAALVARARRCWRRRPATSCSGTPCPRRLGRAGHRRPVGARRGRARPRGRAAHLRRRSMDDLLCALGFLHAQDRLWQMELTRRTGQGRLSEIFGERTFTTDVFLRTLDLYGHAERSLAALAARGARRRSRPTRAASTPSSTRKTGLLEPRLAAGVPAAAASARAVARRPTASSSSS